MCVPDMQIRKHCNGFRIMESIGILVVLDNNIPRQQCGLWIVLSVSNVVYSK